jgi:chromate reductase
VKYDYMDASIAGHKVGYFVGSLATASINRLLARALVRLAPSELEMTEIPFRDLPLYSYDYDAHYPPVATAFKNAIVAVDAVLFVTPEYNRSIPGALKNAIDPNQKIAGSARSGSSRNCARASGPARLLAER